MFIGRDRGIDESFGKWQCSHCGADVARGDEHGCMGVGEPKFYRVLRRQERPELMGEQNLAHGDRWHLLREGVQARSPETAIAIAGYAGASNVYAFAPSDLRKVGRGTDGT